MRDMALELLDADRLSTTFRFQTNSSVLEVKSEGDLKRLARHIDLHQHAVEALLDHLLQRRALTFAILHQQGQRLVQNPKRRLAEGIRVYFAALQDVFLDMAPRQDPQEAVKLVDSIIAATNDTSPSTRPSSDRKAVRRISVHARSSSAHRASASFGRGSAQRRSSLVFRPPIPLGCR